MEADNKQVKKKCKNCHKHSKIYDNYSNLYMDKNMDKIESYEKSSFEKLRPRCEFIIIKIVSQRGDPLRSMNERKMYYVTVAATCT